ncbi:MAG: hypothetical protein KGI82_00235 [Betaproteobacteria bacterium]|nr:hypothetical protein [Betaproteobacteria bacterium]
MNERQFQIYMARVFLAQARAFGERENPGVAGFFWTLLDWARAARIAAASMEKGIQGDLFA